jgi:hypothetical protein
MSEDEISELSSIPSPEGKNPNVLSRFKEKVEVTLDIRNIKTYAREFADNQSLAELQDGLLLVGRMWGEDKSQDEERRIYKTAFGTILDQNEFMRIFNRAAQMKGVTVLSKVKAEEFYRGYAQEKHKKVIDNIKSSKMEALYSPSELKDVSTAIKAKKDIDDRKFKIKNEVMGRVQAEARQKGVEEPLYLEGFVNLALDEATILADLVDFDEEIYRITVAAGRYGDGISRVRDYLKASPKLMENLGSVPGSTVSNPEVIGFTKTSKAEIELLVSRVPREFLARITKVESGKFGDKDATNEFLFGVKRSAQRGKHLPTGELLLYNWDRVDNRDAEENLQIVIHEAAHSDTLWILSQPDLLLEYLAMDPMTYEFAGTQNIFEDVNRPSEHETRLKRFTERLAMIDAQMLTRPSLIRARSEKLYEWSVKYLRRRFGNKDFDLPVTALDNLKAIGEIPSKTTFV